MSVGLQLLRSIVEMGAQTTFRQCYPIWFAEEELPVYQFIATHVSRYARLPSIATLQENGMGLPRASELPQYYLEKVRQRAIFHQLQFLHPNFLSQITTRDMDGAIGTLRQMLANTAAVNPSSDITNIREQGQKVLESYDRAHRSFGLIGTTLGWDCVDDVTDGGHPGDVVVLVGRPNVGKTYALLWMLKKAWMAGASILMCSMEMESEQIARRVIGIQSGLNPSGIRSGRLSSWGQNLMRNTVEGFDDMPNFNIITGNFRKKVSDINKAAEELQPDLIFVDAGYLLTPDKKGAQKSRREVISDVIEELKGVAIDRKRPLVTSVQFNREIKRVHRGDMDLSSIAETDVIAQIATIVMGLRYGDTPNEVTRRRFEMLKNRDGQLIKFETLYSFAPVDFSFTRYLVDDDVANAAAGPDLRAMI
jgi:replicative DNA helicase